MWLPEDGKSKARGHRKSWNNNLIQYWNKWNDFRQTADIYCGL